MVSLFFLLTVLFLELVNLNASGNFKRGRGRNQRKKKRGADDKNEEDLSVKL